MQDFKYRILDAQVKEFKVVFIIVKNPLYQVPDKLLTQVHIILQIEECHFRLNHPEFSQMPRCV